MVSNINLDKFKHRALSCLAAKKEEPRTYPISKSDLLTVGKCSLCNSSRISLLAEVYLESKLNFFSTSVCNDCLYTFRDISPSFKWFQKCWKRIHTKKLEVPNPEMEEIRKRRYEEYHSFLSKYAKNGHLLDVGAGCGTGSKVFQNHGFIVEAVEPEEDKAYYLENFFNIRVCSNSIEEFVLRKKSYDLIIFAHCLEHLDNPVYVMSHIKDLLAESGILYLEVPILWNTVTWSDALYLAHKSNFTEENVIRLVTKSGFEILEKVQFQNTVDEPWDLGLVLKPTQGNIQTKQDYKHVQEQYTVNDVRRLYRKHIPLTEIPALDKVLRYNVPYIEQFYCTLKLESKKMLEPQSGLDYILFESL